MSARRWLLAATLVVGACHKSADPEPAAADPAVACRAIIAGAQQRAMDASFAADHRVPTDVEKQLAHQFMDSQTKILAPVCASDHWSPEVLKCLREATTDVDDKKCLDMLDEAETKHWHQAMAAASSAGRGSSFRAPPARATSAP